MRREYLVKDSFVVNGSQVLVLDRERELSTSNKLQLMIENEYVPYFLTHNDFWIIVKDDRNYKGKSIILS